MCALLFVHEILKKLRIRRGLCAGSELKNGVEVLAS